MAQHRVILVEGKHPAVEHSQADAQFFTQLAEFVFIVWYKFMQWRIEQADGYRVTFHHPQGIFHVFLYIPEQSIQRFPSFFFCFAHDHLAQLEEGLFASFAVEHMFGTEQPDAFGAELHGMDRVFGCFRVGTHTDLFDLIHQFHQIFIGLVLVDISIHQRHAAFVYETLGSVQSDPVAFLDDYTVLGMEGFVFGVYLDIAATHDAAFTPATGHEGRVRGHAALSGKNGLGLMHTIYVFG